MFNIIKGLSKAVVSTVTLPIDIAADVVTMGGVMTDKKETYTASKIKKIMDGIDEATD